MSDDDTENNSVEEEVTEAPATSSDEGIMGQLDDFFGISKAGSTVNTELAAGLTTFLTMAYILLVNPAMLAVAGIPFDDALFATAIAAFVGCTIMGLWANKPFALAPGMGLNAYFTFAVVLGMGIAWEIALAAVLVEGVIFAILSLPQIGWRTAMINAIPKDLKIATGAGIGMFLAIIGFREMGWIQDDGATLVNLATTEAFTYDHGAILSMIGLIAIVIMMGRNIKGAIIYGIVGMAIVGWALGAYDPYNDMNGGPGHSGGAGWGCEFANYDANGAVVTGDDSVDYVDPDCTKASPPDEWFGFVGMPEESLGAAVGALGDLSGDNMADFLLVMIAFLFVDIFDTAGTLYSVGRQAGYVNENDELENSDEAFMSDAAATVVGAAMGTSTTTTYIESAAGVEEGGKTGLTAVVVGVLMLSGLFLAGIFKAIPVFAAATALVVVGAMMMKQAKDINWDDAEMAVPAFITMVMMPFTYSIADGIAWGLISYVAIKLGMGKMDKLNPVVNTLAVLMLMFYIGPGDQSTFDWILDKIF
ncbi:MAG: guanine permease [Euryarchaeota archaeon]|nr:guanine permease [Euryarchaeota archaeon]|tara:strand:+ start:586 stop:2184 length:1599 start_codon:yes stop_codon:yes gene_type:complete